MKITTYLRLIWPVYLIAAVLMLAFTEFGSRSVTAFVENRPAEWEHVILIDAGHGGEDGGATSCTGALESGINLEIALRLEDLMHLLGYRTQMIRRTDISVYTQGDTIAAKKISDLKQRVKIVNETTNGILVSIHQNTFPDGRYHGAQIFYNTIPGSKELAQVMQTAFVQSLNSGSNRKCKKADGVYLMEHIQRPGVLVECGFLSNPAEEANLRAGEYQKKLCCVIASALSLYLNP